MRAVTVGKLSVSGVERVARAIGDCVQLAPNKLILLRGAVGSGKSLLARSVIRHVCGSESLSAPSPTFTLANTYDFSLDGQLTTILHTDLHRLYAQTPDPSCDLEAWSRGPLPQHDLDLIEPPDQPEAVITNADLEAIGWFDQLHSHGTLMCEWPEGLAADAIWCNDASWSTLLVRLRVPTFHTSVVSGTKHGLSGLEAANTRSNHHDKREIEIQWSASQDSAWQSLLALDDNR